MSELPASGLVSTDILQERVVYLCGAIWNLVEATKHQQPTPEFAKLNEELNSAIFSILIQPRVGQAGLAAVINMILSCINGQDIKVQRVFMHAVLYVHESIVLSSLADSNFDQHLTDQMIKTLSVPGEAPDA